MPSTNGLIPKKAVLYARVSTEEQARSGYSLAQQLEALRDYAAREGYEVLEEVEDPGQSGASLERPGMDRVRDLVAAGGVSMVLAQDRDRFAREPAYHYLLKREFEEYSCKIRALNDKGDDSPEGELTNGILDQLAKFERAKTAERSRRGKLRKAREGKILAGHTPNYGFKYNDARDGYVVDEEKMRVVRRIFKMIGVEGTTLHWVKRTLEREGIPSPPTPKQPAGDRRWSQTTIRRILLDDAYKPQSFKEVKALVSTEVASRLDPESHYGIWWFNRRRTTATYIAETGPGGRRYYRRQRTKKKPRDEWIAVPVPDSGIPREVVDSAREAIKHNRRPASAGDRFWELSGGVLYCAHCGKRMMSHRVAKRAPSEGWHLYYRCPTRHRFGKDACTHSSNHQAERIEGDVWRFVSHLVKDPEQLREDLEDLIEQERLGLRADPEREVQTWLERLAELDRQRMRAQDLAIEGLLNHDELRSRLADLEDECVMAKRELEALSKQREKIVELERDRDGLLEFYAGMLPEALDALEPEERHQVYKMLRLRVAVGTEGGIEVKGTLGEGLGVCKLEPSLA
jgi:site-specific DNA recombinase